MRDYISIGSSPADEQCAQVGSSDYHSRSRRECDAFIALIRRTLGDEPEGAKLAVKSFEHDFGTYREVVCHYDADRPEAYRYALLCEDAPAEWDAVARQELGLGRTMNGVRSVRHARDV